MSYVATALVHAQRTIPYVRGSHSVRRRYQHMLIYYYQFRFSSVTIDLKQKVLSLEYSEIDYTLTIRQKTSFKF